MVHVVVVPGDRALGEQAATGLQPRDRLAPAPLVGGHVSDRVEERHPFLGRDAGRAAQVLGDERTCLGVGEVGEARSGRHGATRDVEEMADHHGVVGGGEQLAGVRVELAGDQHPVGVDLDVAERRFETGPRDRRVEHDVGDLVLDVADAGGAVRLGDQLGEAGELITEVGHVGHAAQALPQPERVRHHCGSSHVAVEEDALVGHVHIVEDDHRVGDRQLGRHGSVAFVAVARVMAAGDLRDSRRVCGDRAGDRVGLLALAHALGREHHQLVDDRTGGDVELRASDHHAGAIAVDDPDVQIGIVLLRRRQGSVALGIGDELGEPYVASRAVVEPMLDPFAGRRVGLAQRGRRREKRHRHRREAQCDVVVGEQLAALAEIVGRPGDGEDRVACVGAGPVQRVVAAGDDARRVAEPRVRRHIGDPGAVQEDPAPVTE